MLVDDVGHLQIEEVTGSRHELRPRMWNQSVSPGEGLARLVDQFSIADYDKKRCFDLAECGLAEQIGVDGALLISEVSQAGGHHVDEAVVYLDVWSEDGA